MYFNKNKTRLFLIFALILSFITQPTLAYALSTTMQLSPLLAQMDKKLPVSTQTGERECNHMIMDQAASSEKLDTGMHENCLMTCQFCMSIAFILPHCLDVFAHKAAHIVHVDSVQKPLSIFHVPVYEPPRLAS